MTYIIKSNNGAIGPGSVCYSTGYNMDDNHHTSRRVTFNCKHSIMNRNQREVKTNADSITINCRHADANDSDCDTCVIIEDHDTKHQKTGKSGMSQ